MPVLDPHRTDDHIAWPDDLNGLAPFLGEAESGRHDEDLSYGMDVPVGAGVLAIEMEAAALYCNAAYTKKRGLSICSISDNIVTGEELSPEQRQTSFTAMMKIALETAVKMAAL